MLAFLVHQRNGNTRCRGMRWAFIKVQRFIIIIIIIIIINSIVQ